MPDTAPPSINHPTPAHLILPSNSASTTFSPHHALFITSHTPTTPSKTSTPSIPHFHHQPTHPPQWNSSKVNPPTPPCPPPYTLPTSHPPTDFLPGAQNLQNLPLLYNLYTTYYAPYEPYLRPFRNSLFALHHTASRYLYPYLIPFTRHYLWPLYLLCTRLMGKLLTETPDITSLILLLLVLLVSIKVVGLVRRVVAYWVALGMRVAGWGVVGLLGWYMWQRGMEGSVEDLGWVFGLLSGGVEEAGRRSGEGAYGGERRRGYAKGKGKGARGPTRGGGWG